MGVKDQRYKLGLTQEELMKVAHISFPKLSKLERDPEEIYKTDDTIMLKLMEVFDCRLADLLEPDKTTKKRVRTYNRKKHV